jgi:acyl dehydratase
MEISSKYVNSTLRTRTADITWRMTTNYAASVADKNPRYFDDRHAEGLVAPPMLAVALTWPITADLGGHLENPDFPAEVLATQVHYTEHLIFHRLIRPGDRITIKGRIAAILPHRAGTHCIMQYDALDQNESPVFTEYIGGLLRGVTCTDEGASMGIPQVPDSDDTESPAWEAPLFVDAMDPYVYDGLTDIVFPIHTSPAFAEMVGLPGIIYQGTATLALAVREIINREAEGDPARLKSLACRFSGMVLPDSRIQVECIHRRQGDLFFQVINQNGQKAISRGYVRLDN